MGAVPHVYENLNKEVHCFCFSLGFGAVESWDCPEPTFKRIAGGPRIFAVRFFVFASPFGFGAVERSDCPRTSV